MPDYPPLRAALVTGSARGIGRAIARRLASDGLALTLADLDLQGAEVLRDELRSQGAHTIAVRCDVSSEADVEAAILLTLESHGRLDILINNAGLQHVAPIESFPAEMFERMLRVMLVGPFLGIKHATPFMKSQGWGRIITLASINGLIGFAGKAAYNSAKHGVIGLTRVAALELAAHGVTVNAICPGYVDTPLVRGQLRDLAAQRGVPEERVLEEVIYPLVPQRRLLAPEEVADYVAFLASDQGRGITGQAVVIDGGYTAQ